MVPLLCGSKRLSQTKQSANRPDTVLHDRKEETCRPIDIAVPDEGNWKTRQVKRPADRGQQDVEKVRTKIVPVINGASRTVKKGLDQNLQLLPGHQSATELQKVTVMSTTHIIRIGLWTPVENWMYQKTAIWQLVQKNKFKTPITIIIIIQWRHVVTQSLEKMWIFPFFSGEYSYQ